MVNKSHKVVAYIDLNTKEVQIKSHNNYFELVGGLPLAYCILQDQLDFNPLIVANGPLSGKFPYASKSLFLYLDDNKNIKEAYGGGKIHALMAFNGIDAICLKNPEKSTKDLEVFFENNIITIKEMSFAENMNKNYPLFISSDQVIADRYFNYSIEDQIKINTTVGLNFSNGETDKIINKYDYENLYFNLLDRFNDLTVKPSNNPSCFGCPMGCERSKYGESDQNPSVLTRTLITCAYADSIYREIPIAFACLNTLGFQYTHENLQELPLIFGKIKSKLLKSLK